MRLIRLCALVLSIGYLGAAGTAYAASPRSNSSSAVHPPKATATKCAVPAHSALLASTPRFLLFGGTQAERPLLVSCVRASGVERRLATGTRYSEHSLTTYGPAALAGAYAAVVVDQQDPKGETGKETVQVFNLRTGETGGHGGESVSSCLSNECQQIDSVAVGTDGVSAADAQALTAPDDLQLLCASASVCVATDSFGQLLSSTSPFRGPWNPVSGVTFGGTIGTGNGGAAGGACPSTSLCVIAQDDAIYTSTNPAAGVWTSATPATSPGTSSPELYGVSCASTTLCVAITANGRIAVSTDPTGGASAWPLEDIDGLGELTGVSCPTKSECLVTDSQGNIFTSANPSGGTGAWKRIQGPMSLLQIDCPTASLCVGRTGSAAVAVSTDPASGRWKLTKQAGVESVTCPSASLCLAVDGDKVSYTTDPAAGKWTSYGVSQAAGSLSSVACPTPTMCVASAGAGGSAGSGGEILVSTKPTGGPSTWTPVLADQINCTAAPSLCGTGDIISSDGTGVHVADSGTEYASQGLSGMAITGDTLTWAHNGSPMSTTLTP
jgi:hypothetical protein